MVDLFWASISSSWGRRKQFIFFFRTDDYQRIKVCQRDDVMILLANWSITRTLFFLGTSGAGDLSQFTVFGKDGARMIIAIKESSDSCRGIGLRASHVIVMRVWYHRDSRNSAYCIRKFTAIRNKKRHEDSVHRGKIYIYAQYVTVNSLEATHWEPTWGEFMALNNYYGGGGTRSKVVVAAECDMHITRDMQWKIRLL